MKSYRVELCHTCFTTVIEVEAEDKAEAVHRAEEEYSVGGHHIDLDSLARYEEADMVEEL